MLDCMCLPSGSILDMQESHTWLHGYWGQQVKVHWSWRTNIKPNLASFKYTFCWKRHYFPLYDTHIRLHVPSLISYWIWMVCMGVEGTVLLSPTWIESYWTPVPGYRSGWPLQPDLNGHISGIHTAWYELHVPAYWSMNGHERLTYLSAWIWRALYGIIILILEQIMQESDQI